MGKFTYTRGNFRVDGRTDVLIGRVNFVIPHMILIMNNKLQVPCHSYIEGMPYTFTGPTCPIPLWPLSLPTSPGRSSLYRGL